MPAPSIAAAVSPTARLAALPEYVFLWLDELKAAARKRGAKLIDLGIGSPDRPIPAPLVAALAAAFRDPATHGYPPFRGTDRFLRAAAGYMRERFGVNVDPSSEVLCLSGAKEGMAHLAIAFTDESSVALVPDIYYPVHGRAMPLFGGSTHLLPIRAEDGYLPRLDDIPGDVLSRARLLFLNYPHNPTGALASRGFLESAVAFCRAHDLVLVSDVAYVELTYDGAKSMSVMEIDGARDVVVEFHSLSKSFNMAGARIGFAVGGAALIDVLFHVRSNMGYGTPKAIQEGAAFALEHAREFVPAVVNTYRERRDMLSEGFRSLGWKVTPPPGAMYLWLPVPEPFTSRSWTQHLIDVADVVVSPGDAFGPGGEGFFRVSLVAECAELQMAIDRLRKAGVRTPAA